MHSTHWLTPARLRLAALLVLALGASWLGFAAWSAWQHLREPLGFDFLSFWAASYLSLHHQAAAAYALPMLSQAAYAQVPHAAPIGPWYYPPAALLLAAPLAHWPFLTVFPVFMLCGALLFLGTMRALLPYRGVLLASLAFPGAWLNIILGQNGYLSAAAAGLSLLWLPTRPVLAGVGLGLLAAKPQLAVLLPLLLLLTRQWRALAAAVATTLASNALALYLWGSGLVPAFLHALPDARLYIEQVDRALVRMCSVSAAARLLGASLPLAYGLHAAVAVAALAATVYVWRSSRDTDLRACACVAGTFLISPYLYMYDALWYGLFIGFFIRYALRLGWRRGERELLVVAWFFPALGTLIATLWHVGLAPLMSLSLLALAVRRTALNAAPAADAGKDVRGPAALG
jgi:alpha-1,2-mannosyltransferase